MVILLNNMSRKVPKCVGLILDGNRRWARNKGLSTIAGHKKGFDNFLHIAKHVNKRNIEHLVVYAFSTENWNRAELEVAGLMKLFITALADIERRLHGKSIIVHIVGEKERLPRDLQEKINILESKTGHGTGLHVWICLSYGGRAEIVDAVQHLCNSGEVVTEENLKKHMWTANMPDPEIIVRTGGDKRLSNFLLWQCAYSELFFTDTYWPDFTTEEFDSIVQEYTTRESRKGK